ncbi:uncharacterized protein LOC116307647 [Actinia tenebrosa]|uniref:Uncharacterized protein LOC116307647 n=1 Tax=Actinia tenebrosa TaxID=6105 RepID=A0A6P8J2G4_ACTTE|nr:uncharacterized protein LOC116307647 [Actinia tenebrosa]
MLIKWTECTEKPTLKLLTDALKDAKKIQLIDGIADVLRQNSYRNPPQGGQPVTATHFLRITNDIVHDWKFIGRYLDVEESIIRQIDKDSKTAREKASQMLIKWKQSNGNEATLEVLKAALQDVGRKDVVRKL